MKEIKLVGGKIATVDDSDFDRVSDRKWYILRNPRRPTSFYAYGFLIESGRRKWSLLHRLILNAPKGAGIDHLDGNGLNCQRNNLRYATPTENGRNRGPNKNNKLGLKGIHQAKKGKRWHVQINTDFGLIALCAVDREEAINVYNAMAREFHGEFARLNAV